jgi:WD40 repeat protein
MKAAMLALLAAALAGASTDLRGAEAVDLYGDPLPDGAVARLGTIRYRHPGGYNNQAAFLPDGQTLLTGSPGNMMDRALRTINARTGELLHEFNIESQGAPLLCLSADGRTLATLSVHANLEERELQRRLSLWDVATWHQLKQFTLFTWKMDVYPPSEPTTLAFSPDNKFLAVVANVGRGMKPGVVTILSAETGEELRSLEAKPDELSSARFSALAFSPRGKLLALAGEEGVLLWEYYSEREPTLLLDFKGRVGAMCFSHDGSLLALGSHRHGVPATVYDVAARQPLPALQGAGEMYAGGQPAFSPDDGRLFVANFGRRPVEVFDPRTGALLATWDADAVDVLSVAASSDGKLVAGVSTEAITVWDAVTGERLDDDFVGHVDHVTELAFTPSGQGIVTGASDGTIRLWNAASSRQVRMLRHDHSIIALALSPDGRRIVSCSLDDTVRLWDTATGRELFKLPGYGHMAGNMATEAIFSPDGAQFFSFGYGMVLRAYHAETGRLVAEHKIQPSGYKPPPADPFADDEGVFNLGFSRFSPDASELFIANDNLNESPNIHVFAVATGQEVAVIKLDVGLAHNGFMATPDGRFLTTFERGPDPDRNAPNPRDRGYRGTFLRLRDMTTREVVREVELPGYYNHQAAYSPSGKLLACSLVQHFIQEGTTTQRRLLCIFDAATLQLISQRDAPDYMPGAPAPIAFSPDETRLLTAQPDTTVTVWDVREFRAGFAPVIAP